MADAVTNHTNRNRLRSFYFLSPMFGFEISRELICVFSVLCVLMSRSVVADESDFMMEEFQKKEFSLAKPYRGLGFSSSSQWDLMGTAMVTPDYVRLTPDLQSRQGAVWSRIPLFLRDWELKVHFKIHGVGKKNFNGDGLAIWLTRDRMQNGPVFGNMNQFTGLGVFIDTYPNADRLHDTGYDTFLPLDFWNVRGHNLALRQNQCRSYPYISVMLGNGTLTYDHDRDGRATELGGCTALVRNSIYDTFLLIRYSRNRLKLMVNVDGTQEWKECADISGLHLPTGYFFGASSATGDLSDNHDIISLKLYQLTVQRSAEEEEEEVTIPRVDNINLFQVEVQDEGMSGVQLFFTLLVSILGLGVLAVIGAVVYGRWKQNRRKRFY